MSVAAATTPTSTVSVDDARIEEVLAVPTRAGIFRSLRTNGAAVTAREVAEMFGLHPNVARNHLDQLADAGLVVAGSRRHPGGGRPARVYVAREQAAGGATPAVPSGSQLAVHTLVQLIAGLPEHLDRLALLAEEPGRRLVAAHAGRATSRDFRAALVVAVEALRAAFPEVRISESREGHAVVEGLDVGLRLIGEVDGAVGDALAEGFLRGALYAAGAPTRVCSRAGIATIELDADGVGSMPSPALTVDTRGLPHERGVSKAMREMVGLRPGDHLEVLTDLPGSPAAHARWADRSGHEVVDVSRTRDGRGRSAVRVLLRKATGRRADVPAARSVDEES